MSKEKDDEPELARALEAWLGPIADKVSEVVDLSDDKFDRALRIGFAPEPGEAGQLEQLAATDIAKERERGYQV